MANGGGLVNRVKNLFGEENRSEGVGMRILEADRSPDASPTSPTPNSSSGNSAFDRTAGELEDKYSDEGGGESVPPGAAGPAPEIIPPPRDVLTPETMRKILRAIFNGMERVHGDNWQVSDSEVDMLEPFNTEALNEIWNKIDWLRESEWKATIIWAGVMGVFIGSRSEAGARLIEKIIDGISRLFGSSEKQERTSAGSPESPDSSRSQSTEKPS